MAKKIIRSRPMAIPDPSPEEEAQNVDGGISPPLSGVPAPEGPASKVIERPVHDAHKRAREVLRKAHKQANQILQEAEQKAESRFQQVEEQIRERLREQSEEASTARESARTEGHNEGFARWQRLLMVAHASKQDLVEELKEQVVHLALEIGGKLHRSRLEIEPHEILPLVRDSLAALGGVRSEIQVHVHPDDANAIEDSRAQLVAQDPRWSTLIVVEDDSIRRGGCRVNSELGSVDATVESQLRAIEEHLLQHDGRAARE